jgi:putative aldouronate transport system permease protein
VVSYLPHFLSWVVIAGIWFEFLSLNGVVMDLWESVGGTRMDLLTSKDTIIGVLVASEMWRSVGWDSIIYLSAILAISEDLYEAARLDGANRWQIIRNIVLPHLIPAIITVLIINVGVVLNTGYDQILNFQNDAVLSRIDVIDTYAYRIGLEGTRYSFSTAASLFKSILSLILILVTHFTSKKLTGKGAW